MLFQIDTLFYVQVVFLLIFYLQISFFLIMNVSHYLKGFYNEVISKIRAN